MEFPRFFRVRQDFPNDRVADIGQAVRDAVEGCGAVIQPGASLAVTAGSRGIASIVEVLRALVDELRRRGAVPFLVPAMGSHGGGTVEGQLGVLTRYGITEAALGVPIRASMETVRVGETRWGSPVFLDRHAMESDGIVIAGRIKEHTNFEGRHESGLLKMLAVGLGKRDGAAAFHDLTMARGYEAALMETATVALRHAPVLLGLGLVENAYKQIARIAACLPADFAGTDAELLAWSRTLKPKLPVGELDVLIVDCLGKNISGTGMDTKVIGRIYHFGQPEPVSPRIKRVIVRELTEATGGNATGIGLADFTTTRVFQRIDARSTRLNSMTANHPEMARIPPWFDTDREMLEAALETTGLPDPSRARILQIRDTGNLLEMHASDPLMDELRAMDRITVLDGPFELAFDAKGQIRPI